MVIKMLNKLGRLVDEHSENFSKQIENIRKYQTEATGLKDKITELRNTIERISRRLEE